MKALESRIYNEALDSTYLLGFNDNGFNYKVFDDLKYDIPKYNNRTINDSIIPYKAFRVLEKYNEINQMPQLSAKFVYDTLSEWKIKLDAEQYNY